MRLAMMLVIFAVAFAIACKPDAPASRTSASPAGPSAPVARFRTVRSWPHDPGAFTQGLDFHNGRLFEGTGVEGQSTLREITLETGAVVRKVNLPSDVFGEGITVMGDRIYQVTWKAHKGFVYDLATFRKLREFSYEGEGWGLTNDGTSLILSDGSATIRFLDPATFAVQRTITVKDGNREVPKLNELEMVNGEIWANVWETSSLVRINPVTGAVVGWVNLDGMFTDSDRRRYLKPGQQVDVLNGIAFDEGSGRLLVTGKWWPRLYEITVDSTG